MSNYIPDMNNLKVFKKGEHLFKEGDKASHLYIIQSGKVSVFLQRPRQSIELGVYSSSQVVGEQVLNGIHHHNTNAVALTETKAIEIPTELMKTLIDQSSQLVKIVFKALGDKLRIKSNEIKSIRLERDNTPMPSDQIPRVYGTIFHVANLTGKKGPDGKVTVDWRAFRLYCNRVFLEPVPRIESAIQVLVKLKLATLEMVKNEEDPELPEELGYVHFLNLPAVEQFFEFYQYYLYKSGKGDLLKTDETCIGIVNALIKLGDSEKVDRSGIVRLPYLRIVEFLKEESGVNLNNDHFTLLEKKGLFVKRANVGNGVILSYDQKEFKSLYQNWIILREIERWNQRGFVDMSEDTARKGKKADFDCPACASEIEQGDRFCSFCGYKLAG